MQRTTISFFRKNRLFEAITGNGYLVFIFAFLVAGIIAGAVFSKTGLLSANPKTVVADYLNLRKSGNLIAVFCNSLTTVLPFFAALVFSGVSVPGFIVVLPVIFYRGLLTGSLLYCFVDLHGLNGLLFNLIVVIVPSLLCFFALTLSARESAGFSFSLYKCVFPGKQPSVKISNDFKLYFLRQGVIFALLLFTCLTDTVISLTFISKFGF